VCAPSLSTGRSYSIIGKDNKTNSRPKNVKTYQQEKNWKTSDSDGSRSNSKLLMNVSKNLPLDTERQVTAAQCTLAQRTLSNSLVKY